MDASDGAVAALRWAMSEAALRKADLVVLHAWLYPYATEVSGMAALGVGHEELERQARTVVSEAIEAAGPAPPGVVVEPVLQHGGAAGLLLQAARDADLLVVGSRGRGGFTGLLLGSVSQQCSSHAPCPVVIVPHPA